MQVLEVSENQNFAESDKNNVSLSNTIPNIKLVD